MKSNNTELHERVKGLETDMGFVKSQVSNHIPTSISKLEDKIEWAIKLILGAAIINIVLATILQIMNH